MKASVQLTAQTFTDTDGTRIVRFAGELDMVTYELSARVLRSAARQLGYVGLTIDLSALTFIDAGGVRALVWAHNYAQRAGVPVKLHGAHGLVARVLSLCGLTDMFATITSNSATITPGTATQRADGAMTAHAAGGNHP